MRGVKSIAACLLVGVLCASSAGASQPAPGRYSGTVGAGRSSGKASLVVLKRGRAILSYAMKTRCGRLAGRVPVRIEMRRLHGAIEKRSSATIVHGRLSADGITASGTVSEAVRGGARGRRCESGRRHFRLRRARGETSVLSADDYGHYAGANAAGRPVSFDLVNGGTGPAIENLAVDVDTECWDDLDQDGVDDTLLAHVTGFSGEVESDGSFDIYYAPDEDNEYDFEGTVGHGTATVDVTIGGLFNPDGTPNPTSGRLECDNWGDSYAASLAGS